MAPQPLSPSAVPSSPPLPDSTTAPADDRPPLSAASLALLTFLACKTEPPQSSLLTELAWKLQPDSLSLPSVQFLLQCATIDDLVSNGLQAIPTLAAALTPSPSSPTSPSPSVTDAVSPVVRAVSSLSSYIEAMAACHPSHAGLRVVNSRLRLLVRLHTLLPYLQAEERPSDAWLQALAHALFPARPGADDGDEAQVSGALQQLLRGEVSAGDVLCWYPYAAFAGLWRQYYSLCQQTPTFTDVDMDLKERCAEALLPRVDAEEPPLSPRPASPVPRRLEVEERAGSGGGGEDRAEGSEPRGIVLDRAELSVDDLYALLKRARQGVADAEVRREWQRIVDGSHEDIVAWKAQNLGPPSPPPRQLARVAIKAVRGADGRQLRL